MKKLILLLVLVSTQSVFSQYSWSELKGMYSDVFTLAEQVSMGTNKVIAEEGVISLMKSNGSVSFQRKLDSSVPVEFYNYTLIKTDSTEIPLDKMLTEKVIEKYRSVLLRVKESLKKDRGSEVESILNSL